MQVCFLLNPQHCLLVRRQIINGPCLNTVHSPICQPCLWLLLRSFNWTLRRITQAGGVEEETWLHISPSPSALCSLILYKDAGILGEIPTGIRFLSLNLDVGFGYTLFLHCYVRDNIDVTAQKYTVRHVEASWQSQVMQHRVSFKTWCHTKSEHGQASSISCDVEA